MQVLPSQTQTHQTAHSIFLAQQGRGSSAYVSLGGEALPRKGAVGSNEKWQPSVKSCHWPAATGNNAENSSGRSQLEDRDRNGAFTRIHPFKPFRELMEMVSCIIFIPNIYSPRSPKLQCPSVSGGGGCWSVLVGRG